MRHHGTVCHTAPRKCILIVGICLSHAEPHVGIADNDQRVAFADLFIFLESYLLYIALYPTVDLSTI